MLDDATKKKVVARLRRVEGQVAGIRRMVENDAYCVDVLLQLSAAQGALGQAGKVVLSNHIETCVADAFETGDAAERSEKIEELVDVFARYANTKKS